MLESYWIAVTLDGRRLRVGRVTTALSDAPAHIRNADIFYRVQKYEKDFLHYKTQTVGFDLNVFEYIRELGLKFVVTYAEDKRRLFVVKTEDHDENLNFGRGWQKRARLSKCLKFENREPLVVPITRRVVLLKNAYDDFDNPGEKSEKKAQSSLFE